MLQPVVVVFCCAEVMHHHIQKNEDLNTAAAKVYE
jgi:hypothetical protein